MADQNTNTQGTSTTSQDSTQVPNEGLKNLAGKLTEGTEKSVSPVSDKVMPLGTDKTKEERGTAEEATADAKQTADNSTDSTEQQPEVSQKDALRKMQQQGEELNRVIATQIRLIEKNPDLLQEIAETDPLIADRIVQKKYNMNSYKEYQKYQEVEKTKDENPELYEMKKEFFEIKREREANEAEKFKAVEKAFFDSKGIIINPFDKDYIKVKEAMSNLSPDFIKKNPELAHLTAYNIAFPNGGRLPEQKIKDEALASQTTTAGRGAQTIQTPPRRYAEATMRLAQAMGVADRLK